MCEGGLIFANPWDSLSHTCPISGGIVHRRSSFDKIYTIACYLPLTHFIDLGTKISMSVLIRGNQSFQLIYPLSILDLKTRSYFSVIPWKLKSNLYRTYGIHKNHYVCQSGLSLDCHHRCVTLFNTIFGHPTTSIFPAFLGYDCCV